MMGSVIIAGTNSVIITNASGGSAYVTMSGTLDISGASLNVSDPSNYLQTCHGTYTVTKFSPGGLTGQFASVSLPSHYWFVKYNNAAGIIQIFYNSGTLVRIQ